MTGFVSGALLFFFLGVIAFYTGMQLWHMYLKLDSDEYPVQNYSDLTERIYGRIARHGVNILQTIQLLFNVAVLVLGTCCVYPFFSVAYPNLCLPYRKCASSFSNVERSRKFLPISFEDMH